MSRAYSGMVLIFVEYMQQLFSGHLKMNGWCYNSVNGVVVEILLIVRSWVTR